MCARNTVLLVEPHHERRACLQQMLEPCAGELVAVASRRQALRALLTKAVSVIVTAPNLPDGHWQDFISDVAPMPSAPNVIVVSLEIDRPSRAEALQLGAFALVVRPKVPGDVQWIVELAARDWMRRCDSPPAYAAQPDGAFPVAPRSRAAAGCLDMPANPHILVVDDERMILELVARILEPEGLTVSTAENGYQAVHLVRLHAEIALAILDWYMPGMTGEQVLDCLVEIRPGMKAIVASGTDPAEVAHAFAGRRVDGFLRKPFKTEALVQAVKSALAA